MSVNCWRANDCVGGDCPADRPATLVETFIPDRLREQFFFFGQVKKRQGGCAPGGRADWILFRAQGQELEFILTPFGYLILHVIRTTTAHSPSLFEAGRLCCCLL